MNQEDIYKYKSYLFTIAYNMVGDTAVAEDIVQDIFLKWLESDRAEIKNVKTYLSRMVINKAIDLHGKLKKEREEYKGLWMPVPVFSEENTTDENYTIEYALLFLLEKLNPYERAVFILKEVFSYSYEEVAEFLEVTQDNCRQLLHRAKEKIGSSRKKGEADPKKHYELLQAFLLAMHKKEFQKLEQLFKQDITLYSDGGGKMAAALKPIHGSAKVIKFLAGVDGLDPDAVFTIKPVLVNNKLGTLIFRNGLLDSVIYIVEDEGKLNELYFLRNPDKIKVKNL